MSGETPGDALPPPIASLLAAARVAHEKGDRPGSSAKLMEALRALDFPATFPHVLYPLVEELTPVQRRLAEIIARADLPAPWELMPEGAAARRWLGIDPPGPLEMLIEHDGRRVPLWRILLLARRTDSPLEVLETLPIAQRLDALASDDFWVYRIDGNLRAIWAIASKLTAEGRAWALARLHAPPLPIAEVHAKSSRGEQFAYLALVRAGHVIDPVWDVFLPIGTPVPVAIAAECARGLSLERLERVAPALLEKTFGPHAIQTGLALLAHHDSPAVARFVWTKSERSFPRHRDAERKALIAIAAEKPAVAEVVAELRGKAPKARTLTVTARLAPRSEADLTKLQAEQLIESGRRWDRKTLPVSRRLSLDENDQAALGALLEHLTIAESGKPAFEAWLYQGDSGTFFAGGTTKVIAQRVQMGIEIAGKRKDPALADALGRLDTSKGAIRALADVRAATLAGLAAKKSGRAAKAPVTKKAPAKKPAAKKTAKRQRAEHRRLRAEG